MLLLQNVCNVNRFSKFPLLIIVGDGSETPAFRTNYDTRSSSHGRGFGGVRVHHIIQHGHLCLRRALGCCKQCYSIFTFHYIISKYIIYLKRLLFEPTLLVQLPKMVKVVRLLLSFKSVSYYAIDANSYYGLGYHGLVFVKLRVFCT